MRKRRRGKRGRRKQLVTSFLRLDRSSGRNASSKLQLTCCFYSSPHQLNLYVTKQGNTQFADYLGIQQKTEPGHKESNLTRLYTRWMSHVTAVILT